MRTPGWEDVVDRPDGIDDDGAERIVRETDHVPPTEHGPGAVADLADAQLWKSANARHRISLRKR